MDTNDTIDGEAPMDLAAMAREEEQQEREAAKQVTVKDLDDLCNEIVAQRAKCDEMKAALAQENILLAKLEGKAVLYLEELDRESYKGPTITIGSQEQWRFNLPQTDEDKAKFFEYLRERGLFDKLATVNAASYNAFLNAEWKIAQEEGRGFDFAVPGVPEPKLYKKPSIRKNRS